MTESERYLHELRAKLPRLLRRRVTTEIRNHFREAISTELSNGLDRDEAERLTIERLGPPERLAAQFATDAPKNRRRSLAIAIVVAVAILAVGFAAFSHTRHATPASSVTSPQSKPRVLTEENKMIVIDGRVLVAPTWPVRSVHIVLRP